ncbi:hypothetical protein Tco_1452459, partial [Tanacetum coccineum]
LIEELDLDADISLVPPHDAEIQEKISDDTEVLLEEEETTELIEEPTELVEDQGSGKKGNKSTATSNLVYIRRSVEKRKDKGKAIMIEDEFLQEEYNKAGKKEAVAEVDIAHVIDWNDPSVIRDDLVKLWILVQEKYNSSRLTEDKEIELWVKLKMLFEPDAENFLELQKYMHDPLNWWLYDTCVVHHVFTKKGQDIFMLVEKDYPLTKGIATLMLVNKLRVDQHSEMADELLIKLNNIANRTRT